jgi:hypothetical protein
MDGLERLHYAWGKADGEARRAFLKGILEAQGMRGESEITMVSQVNAGDGSPAVCLQWGEHILHMESTTAKRHGLAILETALAADADAFLFAWVRDVVGAEPEKAAQLLMDFRRWRDRQDHSREGA